MNLLCRYIFPNLGWRDLFSLRSVSQIGYRSVQAYFAQMKDLDLTDFSRNFSPLAFQVLVAFTTTHCLYRECGH